MLHKWDQLKEKNIRNFNKLFDLSQVDTYPSEATVDIQDIVMGGLRRVFIDGEENFIALKSSRAAGKKMKMSKSESKVVNAIRKFGVVYGNYDLAKKIGSTEAVVYKALLRLKINGIVRVDTVTINDRGVNKIYLA